MLPFTYKIDFKMLKYWEFFFTHIYLHVVCEHTQTVKN
jgi:hypothetical protein